jgi:hypothetical protein
MKTEAAYRPPSLGLTRRYLSARGWQIDPLPDSSLDVFRLDAGSEAEVQIVLPRSTATPDVDRRIYLALRTLADLDDRPIEEIAGAIERLEYDVMKVRLPDHLVFRESVKLPIAARFLKNMRSFLVDAAAAELTRSPFLNTAAPATSQQYGDNCRLGHTFHGSFGFTIESPTGPKPEVLPREEMPPPPFERRVIQRVARGMFQLQGASDNAASPPLDAFESGFNANMYDRFAELIDETTASEIAFEFEFSPAWPPADDLRADIRPKISAAMVPFMREAAKSLRRVSEPSGRIPVEGTLVRLEASGNPADLIHPVGSREIILQADNLTSTPVNIHVRLVPADYLAAIAAHKAFQRVRVTGRLQRLGPKRIDLLEPADFRVLTE